MIRTLIQFDEDTWKIAAASLGTGKLYFVRDRELIAMGLDLGKRKKVTRVKQFQSFAAGRSKQGRFSPLSEKHDEALARLRK